MNSKYQDDPERSIIDLTLDLFCVVVIFCVTFYSLIIYKEGDISGICLSLILIGMFGVTIIWGFIGMLNDF